MSWRKVFNLPALLYLKLQLRLTGVVYGKKLRGGNVIIRNTGSITLGDNVLLRSNPAGEPFRTALLTHCPEAKITIANNCVLNGTRIHCRTAVSIADYCLFGPGVRLIDNDSHRPKIDIKQRRLPPDSAPIIIRKNVWIGLNSIVLKGVELGENTIVAAHSVVTKSFPENSLVAGNPARIIKPLD